jgi:hypothetical protein
LETAYLVIIQLAAVRHYISDLVELGKDLLHRFLTA